MSDLSDDDFDANNESSTKNKFNKAAEFIEQRHSEFSSDDLLEFYGLYKQANCGECNTSKPGFFNIQGRAKWDAWNKLGKLDGFKAMELYVKKLQSIKPEWNPNRSSSAGNKNFQWVCTSSHIKEPEEEILDVDKTAFDYIRENNLEKLKEIVNIINVNDIEDRDGMLLMHWAADRNVPDILEYLISIGANVNILDSELQTPLHYAAACGHIKCIQILLKNGADKTIVDRDNMSCVDVAYDDTIKNFLIN